MDLKSDWPEAQERFTAWWNGSSLGRPALSLTAVRDEAAEPPPVPVDPRDRWIDCEYRFAEAEFRMNRTYFGGEAFPYYDPCIGPGSLALFLGSKPSMDHDTVWYDPVVDSIRDLPEFAFQPDNVWWRKSLDLARIGMERGAGRYLVSFPDLIENLDVAASLVGTQEILYAIMDDVESVKSLITRINEMYFVYYDLLYELQDGDRLGTCFSAFSVWGKGRVAKLQCDASAMISPEHFAEIVAPGLAAQCERLDYSVYHLDGPGATQHVAELVKIPGLNAIQWTPGAGQPQVHHESWWPMYDEIRRAGKGLLLLGARFDGVEPLARHLGPDGVLIGAQAPSEAAADEMIAKAINW